MNSRGDPYTLTKQGPKVGRKPSSPPAEIWDMLMKVVPMKSSFPTLSLSFNRNLILSHMEGNCSGGRERERESVCVCVCVCVCVRVCVREGEKESVCA